MITQSHCPICKSAVTIEEVAGVGQSFACSCGFRLPLQADARAAEIIGLHLQIANRDAQIAALIAAGDALGVDQTRPGWQRRWADWMRAKGF